MLSVDSLELPTVSRPDPRGQSDTESLLTSDLNHDHDVSLVASVKSDAEGEIEAIRQQLREENDFLNFKLEDVLETHSEHGDGDDLSQHLYVVNCVPDIQPVQSEYDCHEEPFLKLIPSYYSHKEVVSDEKLKTYFEANLNVSLRETPTTLQMTSAKLLNVSSIFANISPTLFNLPSTFEQKVPSKLEVPTEFRRSSLEVIQNIKSTFFKPTFHFQSVESSFVHNHSTYETDYKVEFRDNQPRRVERTTEFEKLQGQLLLHPTSFEKYEGFFNTACEGGGMEVGFEQNEPVIKEIPKYFEESRPELVRVVSRLHHAEPRMCRRKEPLFHHPECCRVEPESTLEKNDVADMCAREPSVFLHPQPAFGAEHQGLSIEDNAVEIADVPSLLLHPPLDIVCVEVEFQHNVPMLMDAEEE